jgi:predicted alpha/beta superfamily hydrolase
VGELLVLGSYGIDGLAGPRRVRVWLPRGFDRNKARPALYLFDGQNVFGDHGAHAGGWHANVSVDGLSPRTNYPPIVVGIDHGGTKRIEDLGRPDVTDRLLDWMGHTLMPDVRSRFGATDGPIGAVVGGSSMGGLAALYAHFRRPDLFGGAIAMSPSFWFGGRFIFPFVAREPNPYVTRVYLDCGRREGGGRMATLVEEMGRHLSSRGWRGAQLMIRIDPRGAHAERAWRRRLPKALRFMFTRARS